MNPQAHDTVTPKNLQGRIYIYQNQESLVPFGIWHWRTSKPGSPGLSLKLT